MVFVDRHSPMSIPEGQAMDTRWQLRYLLQFLCSFSSLSTGNISGAVLAVLVLKAKSVFKIKRYKLKGGLISHLHFQFASTREQMIKENGKLKKPHWYATMCDADATMQQRCNIVRALHKLEIDTEVR